MIVYVIRNQVNGKVYVGQTTQSLESRWRHHCWTSTLVAAKMPISRAIAKYGKENFTIAVIRRCRSQRSLDSSELSFAKKLRAFVPHGYNLRAGNGPGSLSPKTKAKISAANKGRKPTAQARHNMSLGHLGRRRSPITDMKLSERYKGRPVSRL